MRHSLLRHRQRAQGMPGARAPAASRANGKKHTSRSHCKVRRNITAFPAQWVTAYTRSPRSAGLVSLRRPGLSRPGGGHQRRGAGTTRLRRPPWRASSRAPASVHRIPRPRFVTIGRSAPLIGAGCAGDNHIFTKNGIGIFLPAGLDRAGKLLLLNRSDLPVGQAPASSRHGFKHRGVIAPPRNRRKRGFCGGSHTEDAI
jgi:hypothetical protein